jgi:hypothetical protein
MRAWSRKLRGASRLRPTEDSRRHTSSDAAGGASDPTRKVVPEMLLTPILPFSQAPLVVGLDTEGTQIQALCLNPVSTLQLQVLEHRTMTDLKAFQEFWSKTMDTYAGRHDHVEVAFPL